MSPHHDGVSPDEHERYLEACRSDAEALLACVVFAASHPPDRERDLDLDAGDGLEERLAAFMEFDDGDDPASVWKL
jgi:hypothetical protein